MQPTPAEEIAAYWLLTVMLLIIVSVMVVVSIACFAEWRKVNKRKKFRQQRDEIFGGARETLAEHEDCRARGVVGAYPSDVSGHGQGD